MPTPRELAESAVEKFIQRGNLKPAPQDCVMFVTSFFRKEMSEALASLISQERADADRRVREVVGEVVGAVQEAYYDAGRILNQVSCSVSEEAIWRECGTKILAAARAVEKKYAKPV